MVYGLRSLVKDAMRTFTTEGIKEHQKLNGNNKKVSKEQYILSWIVFLIMMCGACYVLYRLNIL